MADKTTIPTHGNFIDITGQTFNRWTAISYIEQKGTYYWLFRCLCGTIRRLDGGNVRSGHSKSCGCLRVYEASLYSIRKRNIVEYRIWAKMKGRCLNPRDKAFDRYGGRGIRLHPAWVNDFKAFLDYIGPRPSPKHSIDRFPNNDGSYEPGNIRWATSTEQGRNKRNNHLITINGETLCLSAWAERMGFDEHVVQSRLRILHWTPEKAVLTPLQFQKHHDS